MNKVFLLVGAGSGADLSSFEKRYGRGWNVYMFECNPIRIEKLKKDFSDVTIIPFAAWTKNSRMKFNKGTWNINGSSIISEKKNVDTTDTIEVDTIDFSFWIKENLSKEDYVVLLLDIEGAEHDVLDKMFEDDTLSYVDELFLEFHGRKIKGFDMARETALVDKIIDKFKNRCFIYEYHNHDDFCSMNSEQVK